MVEIILECNGSDAVVLDHEVLRTEGSLLRIAQELAQSKEVDLSDISQRFADRVRRVDAEGTKSANISAIR